MKNISALRSTTIAASLALGTFLLSACVSNKPSPRPHATMLLSVVLRGALAGERQPTGLIVTVDEGTSAEGRQFAFNPNTRIPGHYTTFLVHLELPAGHHHLTGLSGVTADGLAAPEFDVALDMPFDGRNGTTDYLGHFELSYGPSAPRSGAAAPAAAAAPRYNTSSNLVLADAYQDDLPEFVHGWPALRGHLVTRRAPTRTVMIPTEFRNRAALEAQTRGREESAPPPRLDSSAAAGLPTRARAAFLAFLGSGYPRAFVVAATGDTGTATGGVGVIARAVRKCRQIQPSQKSGCRLFALDDTLISSSAAKP
jgi:hypothetical protein